MNKPFKIITLIALLWQGMAEGQTVLTIYPDSITGSVNDNLTPGVFYVPKTSEAAADFMANGIHHNAIRTSVIESALNGTSDLTSCLSLLTTVQADLQALSQKCDKLIFIFEKMPAWLSSSSDGNPAATPGWYVLNTKPPADWNSWQTVVDSITSKIVNQFGISNAYFEIWNEPDLGSWTGSMDEYFTLYQKTYDGIKSANPSAKAGGPAVNFWANNIFWQAPYGYNSNATADSSLIGQLLDSAVTWNKVPDFISWHNFNLSYQEFANASNYLQQKLSALSLSNIPLVVSEWNAPSQVRDSRLATAFMLKAQLSMSETSISNNAIAAWQDFDFDVNEFHTDYGLLTYGAIHKPAYNSILLSEMLVGSQCKMTSVALFDGMCSLVNDTLLVLISNYCPPPFIEAFNHTLYQGQFNANQIDSAGYIDIVGNNIAYLDSIYQELIVIPNNDPLQIAINNSISIYQHYDSIYTTARTFTLAINGYSGNYTGQLYLVDSTQNNMQHRYDSLLAEGYIQSNAISAILPDQSIQFTDIAISGGQYTIALQSNAVCLIKIHIPGISHLSENKTQPFDFVVYPNPASDRLTLVFATEPTQEEGIEIYNARGEWVQTVTTAKVITEIDISALSSGLYYIHVTNSMSPAIGFIKM